MGDLLLPPGSTLLHIGPFKTGTTALQGALYNSRSQLVDYGVVYPGRGRAHHPAALAMTGRPGPRGWRTATRANWDSLVRDVAKTGDQKRVVVSSEFFCGADVDTVAEVIDGLGGPRVHVLVTLRPLAKILPSAWQQYVRNGLVATYDEWLDGMLRQPPFRKPTPSFWKRHHHDVLIERWASVAGPQNVTVLVLDEADRSSLTGGVEQMLGLPHGLLKPEPGRTNRSLTEGEIELVRLVNLEFHERGWSDEVHKRYIAGMQQHLQDSHRPTEHEPRITTPGWALERAAEIGASAAAVIGDLGVRVIGDLGTLGQPPPGPADDRESETAASMATAAAAAAVVGTILAGIARDEQINQEALGLDAVQQLSSGELVSVVMDRLSRRSRTIGKDRISRVRRVHR